MDNHDHNDVPIDDLLSPRIADDSRTELRGSLLTQTTRVLRRRHRFKQVGYLVVLLGCYLAGLGTMRLANARDDNRMTKSDALLASRPSSAHSESTAHVLPPIDQDPEVSASLLERVAALSPDNQAFLYRRAGDRYLDEDGDVQAALRCYGRALDRANREELAISEDDNWLLMELKKARLEGKNHAQTGT